MFYCLLLLVPLSVATQSAAAALESPVVRLDYGTFQGMTIASGNVSKFLGVPYAKAPTGNLRFSLPQAPDPIPGIYNATEYGMACPQKFTALPDGIIPNVTIPTLSVTNFSEDCLSINIIKPASIKQGELLPVLFWIHGGGFYFGSSSQDTGEALVERSVFLDQPILHVSINYRLNAFGTLAGKEVKAAGVANLGLHDQKFGLEWVKKYIQYFGGDQSKVTIWGESAGASNVGLHLVSPYSAGLYRGAVMESGSPQSTPGDVGTAAIYQDFYDRLSAHTNCSTTADSLECMRHVPMESILEVVNSATDSPGLSSVFTPGIDGVFFDKSPARYVIDGDLPNIPFISGSVDDEGTIFVLSNLNITTNDQFLEFIKNSYFPHASSDEINQLGQLYPDDPTQGSPYGTGLNNSIAAQYKRLASFHGDVGQQQRRNLMLKHANDNCWSFLFKRRKSTPTIGSFHTSDLSDFTAKSYVNYGSNVTVETDFVAADAMIFFVRYLNPNIPQDFPRGQTNLSGVNEWKPWSEDNAMLLEFDEPYPNITIAQDDYRKEGMDLISELYIRELP